MAEVIGFLREDATYGEKETLKLLKANLPKDFSVYVETPLHKKRDLRYPDFVVLTNYGVIVLEVKDWIMVERADPSGAMIRTRKNESRHEPNPVGKARDFAITLSNQLNAKRRNNGIGEAIPWSYAAVLVNLPSSVITQLRSPWGEEFVLGKDDLSNSALLLNRLKNTFPAERMRPLTKVELDLVRATVYPVVEIEVEGRAPFVLDTEQEKIVAEPVRVEVSSPSRPPKPKEIELSQDELFESLKPVERDEDLPEQDERLSRNVSIRLVRGFAGSGKSLVLIQRAKFLAAQYPDWKIGVFTFNKPLQEHLLHAFAGTTIRPRTFHSICQSILRMEGDAASLDIWLDGNKFDFDIIRKLGKSNVQLEFDWLRDMGIVDRDVYFKTERHGIGKELRLTTEQRGEIFEAFQDYRSYLNQNALWDWPELSLLVNQKLDGGIIVPETFDAILIDEAQDWAPNWLKVANRLLHPEHGLLFLADDPSQSIYRSFSWKEKGVNVIGRTRWLKIPYRNTHEIYQAAYSMIESHDGIQSSLMEEGELIKPDLSDTIMRHGLRPIIQKCRSVQDELTFLKNNILALRREGYRDNQIAVLVRYRGDLKIIQEALKGYDLKIHAIHGFKGLEIEVVFIPHLQNTFQKDGEEYETAERRIIYMAMSRAREKLYMTYFGKLPHAYDVLRRQALADFVD